MKRILYVSLTMIFLFAGCTFQQPKPEASKEAPAKDAPPTAKSSSEAPTPSSSALDSSTPDGAAEKLLAQIGDLDENTISELAREYFSIENLPDSTYSVIKPITERVSYKIGNHRITGDKAEVDVSITSVDAQSALNSVIPGALAHLAALQIAGKDVSQTEKILAEYAAKNIEWEKLPTVKTDATLYLVKGGDGEWKVDATNPANISFLNAISGGAVEIAQNIKFQADRFK